METIRDLILLLTFMWLSFYAIGLWERREHLAAGVFVVFGLTLYPTLPLALTYWR